MSKKTCSKIEETVRRGLNEVKNRRNLERKRSEKKSHELLLIDPREANVACTLRNL